MKKELLWTMETELEVELVIGCTVVVSDSEMEGKPKGWLEVQRTSWATDLLQEAACDWFDINWFLSNEGSVGGSGVSDYIHRHQWSSISIGSMLLGGRRFSGLSETLSVMTQSQFPLCICMTEWIGGWSLCQYLQKLSKPVLSFVAVWCPLKQKGNLKRFSVQHYNLKTSR